MHLLEVDEWMVGRVHWCGSSKEEGVRHNVDMISQ
jgi:hypothetical protein